MEKMNIGMFGMAVMGSNLALNMADHNFKVACYNYTRDLTEEFFKNQPHPNMKGFFDLKEFVNSLEKPRKIMLMIMSGSPVDSSIESLIPLLEEGDIIMDGGNSFFEDTIRRHNYLKNKGIRYFGVGISGGEKGARTGAAIMPAGDKEAYELIKPIFEAVAAKAENQPCCSYIGTDGAGHYVKMVHNGIEYADMQLIAETYLILKYLLGLDNLEISQTFNQWNKGELKSFLIGITADILAEKENNQDLIDLIVDSSGQKGTGRWTSIAALNQGVNASIITSACNARLMSNLLTLREKMAEALPFPATKISLDKNTVQKALYVAKIAAYAQGFALYQSGSELYKWNLDLSKIAAIFRAGCIIQADFLNKISEVYQENPNLENLVLAPFFNSKIQEGISALREVVSLAISQGIAIPSFANSIEYLDAMRSPHLGANLIQGQRDYFGSHTFKRKDKEGSFHHHWQEHYPR